MAKDVELFKCFSVICVSSFWELSVSRPHFKNWIIFYMFWFLFILFSSLYILDINTLSEVSSVKVSPIL